jgi:hypothetical protein
VINRTRWLWLCEFPQTQKFQTPERAKLNDEAVKFRDQVASGNPKIVPPANPVATDVSLVTMPSTGEKKSRRFTWRKEEGV